MFGESRPPSPSSRRRPAKTAIATGTTESATEEDVEAALDQLVSELPASFRPTSATTRRRSCACRGGLAAGHAVDHAAARDLAPGGMLAVAPGRLRADVVCYVGPGTWAADDAQVDWDAFIYG